MIITIDGPAASGKSTIAQGLAQLLHYYYLNTGFLYRALGYILVHEYGYTHESLAQASDTDIAQVLNRIRYNYSAGKPVVHYMYTNITSYLKNEEVDAYASIISSNRSARQQLLGFQQAFGREHDIVADGRDCGTVVFPQAECKIFLTADLTVRAQRWQKDLAKNAINRTLDECVALLKERDERDSSRADAPLLVPEDAHVIDSSSMNVNDIVSGILDFFPGE